jgi:hypothetical protein
MPINDQDRQRIIQAIRAYIAKERISREEFARRAKLGKSTVDKLVVGIFSDRTVLQIESMLNLKLTDSGNGPVEIAGDEFGKYTRDDTKDYAGKYVFARPAFRDETTIHAFAMEVLWDASLPALLVREMARDKRDGLQFGKIYIPRASAHIFILSNEDGWLKSVILSRIDVYKRMKGVMLTMGHAFANVYAPVAIPVIMNKYDNIDDRMIGEIKPGAKMYRDYSEDLLAVEQSQYAKWIAFKPPQ